MIKEFYHGNMGMENVSFAWARRTAVKNFDRPRIVVCVPVGSKIHHNAFSNEKDAEDAKTSEGVRIPATVPVQWLASQMQLVHPLNTSSIYMTQFGMYAGEARQVLTMNALANVQEDGYILYWDDDTIPPPLGLYTMANYMEQHPEVGALSAVYCTREDPPEPVIYGFPTTGSFWGFAMGPKAQPTEIGAAGAGFLLVRVEAIKKAMALNPNEPIWADMKTNKEYSGEPHDPEWGTGITWGHDIRFCHLIRQAGYKVMVDGRVECGHLDIATQKMHYLPENCLPKRRGRDYHREQYCDDVYGAEGARHMRYNGMLMENVLNLIEKHSKVVEIGCGPGVMGLLLSAQGGVEWTGFDQSEVAVQMAMSRFQNAYKKAVHELTEDDLRDADVVLAMEIVEHLEPEDAEHLFGLITSLRKKLIFTTPDNCMGPGQEFGEEHVDLFNEEKVKEITGPFCKEFNYKIEVKPGDDKRLVAIFEPAE